MDVAEAEPRSLTSSRGHCVCRSFKTGTVGIKESELCSHHRSEAFSCQTDSANGFSHAELLTFPECQDKTLKVGFSSETGGLWGLSGSGSGTSILRGSSERHLCTRSINRVHLFTPSPCIFLKRKHLRASVFVSAD